MRFLLVIAIIITQLSVYSQVWMRPPFLNKSVEEAGYFEIKQAFDTWWNDREYEKGNGFMPYKRWEYLNSMRCYPDGVFPQPGSYYDIFQGIIRDYETHKTEYEKTDLSNWTPLGLTAWTNGNNGYNPGNGRVNAVAVDPNNSNIIFIASPSGGVWKSNNGGQSWNTTFDNMPHLGVSSIAVHPDSSNIIFIGTGDRDAWDSKATGIYKSTNGGNTWNPSGLNTTGWNSINKIIYNPLNYKTMFASANSGIFRSYDSGQTWTQVYTQSRVTDLLYHPSDTTILYGGGDAFVKSSNGGSSFIKNTNLPADTNRIEIAVTPANSSYVYVLASNSYSSYGGTYRSTNSGNTFTMMSDSPNYLGYSMDADDDSGQGWYDLAIAASPVNANTIYIGGINVWKSSNGGSSYNIISHWVFDNPNFYTHADIHYLGFYGNRLYCGSDGGVFYSDDFGSNWTDISEGLGISQVYRLASSPADPDFIVCGSQDNGSNRLQNGHWTHIYGADGMQPMTHRTNTNIFYFSYQMGGLMKTTDNGNNVEYIQPYDVSGDWITPFDMHPTNSNIIYAGYNDVYKSDDAGWTWNNLTNGMFGSQNISHLKVSPANPNYIYASRGAYLYISTDNGQNWTHTHSGYSGNITGIAPSYSDPEKLWVSVSGSSGDRIFLSEDAYQTYTNVTGNISGIGIRCIEHQKNSHDALFIGTENTVLYRDTTMTAWIPYMNGLPNVNISDLEINYTNNKLRAGTYGRGIWETPIPITQHIEEQTIYNQLSIYPNPAHGTFTADLSSIDGARLIKVFDVKGKLALEIQCTPSLMTIDMSSFVSGTYFIKVITDKKQYIQRLILYN